MGKRMETIEDVLAEMLQLQATLPSRPSPEEVQISQQRVLRVDSELATRLEEIFVQARPGGVPSPVFRALQEMRETVLRGQAQDDKRMAVATMEVEERHRHFESLLQRMQMAASHPLNNMTIDNILQHEAKENGSQLADGKHNSLSSVAEDHAVLDLGSEEFHGKISTRAASPRASSRLGGQSWRLSPGATTNMTASNLGQLGTPSRPALSPSPTIGAVPELSTITEDGVVGTQVYSAQLLDTWENAVIQKLDTLDLSNRGIFWLTESIGLLTNLTSLDLSGNQLQAVPESIGELAGLTQLDVQANELKGLPDSLGCLSNLTKLNVQKNSIEELPWTIGLCTSLVELTADFNELKALPEAVGHLTMLRHMSVHLNRLKSLPTTISSLTNLTELAVHFNHLESVPESLCLLPNLTKLDISSNFAELRELPQSIGQLQSLRELDISCNHLTVLPDSFALLTGLRKLKLDGNPLRTPPLQVAEQGKEAVLEYMTNLVLQKETARIARSNKRGLASLWSCWKRRGTPNVKEVLDLDLKA